MLFVFQKKLKHFVGPDTFKFFDFLQVCEELLKMHVSDGPAAPNYQHTVSVVKHLLMVNDCAERILGMGMSLHSSSMPENEKQLQVTYKAIDAVRKFQRSTAISSERVTKKALTDFLSHSLVQK